MTLSSSSPQGTGGFWIPNELVHVALPKVKAAGLAVYCVLACCDSPREYPSVEELAKICLTTVNKVENILDALLDMGLLNYNDVVTIRSG